MEYKSPAADHNQLTAMDAGRPLRGTLAVLPAALLSAMLFGLSTPALADHDVEHVVTNLKGGLGALEQRVWDCEHGVGGACPGTKGEKGDKGDTGEQGIQGVKGDTGGQGIQGVKGDTGEQGIQGVKGDTGLAAWESVSVDCNSSGGNVTCTANCTGDKKVLGGGVLNTNANWSVIASYPVTGTGWTAVLSRQTGSTTTSVTTYALCANTN